MVGSPRLIGSEIYRRSTYGAKHPLAIPRVSTALDLIRAMDWLGERQYIDSPCANPEQLTRFHDEDYIEALQQAEAAQNLPDHLCEQYSLGRNGNPFFGEMFRRPATASGGSILAAKLLSEPGIVHSPAGGTHHGRPGRASGFCYLNDPVLGIFTLLDQGIAPVAYVDIDAHHGDGVQDAFADDDRLWTISVHEQNRWPFTGATDDRGGGQARNMAVPTGLNDSEMMALLNRAILPLMDRIQPAAIVLQCGADALEEDPLAKLSLSNRAHMAAVSALMPIAPRLMVLGGGGYNPWSVGRCWAVIWAVLNGHDPTVPLTGEAESVLRGLTWRRAQGRNPPETWFTTLVDRPRPGPVRAEISDLIDAVLAP
ncbi:MAG: acetoin utilization protein AcuC [Pseudomonadota bacterium]